MLKSKSKKFSLIVSMNKILMNLMLIKVNLSLCKLRSSFFVGTLKLMDWEWPSFICVLYILYFNCDLYLLET